MNDQYIQFKQITKYFPGQRALNNVSFSVREGEIHALVGENGAGKSTLLNILHGVISPASGNIFINGEEVRFPSAYAAIKAGVVKVHQEITLVPEMTVMENLFLGFERTKTLTLNRRKMIKETEELLKTLKCNLSPDDKVKNLNVGEKQMLQIAKALHLKAKIISFDEPTSSLTNVEVETLLGLIRNLKEKGITILYITHKLDEVYKISDRATVLRDGEYINTFDVKGLSKETLIKNMVGRVVTMFAKRQKPSVVNWDEVVLEAEGLTGRLGFRDISFKLHKGEILGFYGLVGAKRTETLMSLFGAYPLVKGTIHLDGKQINIKTPRDATRNSLSLVPENRKDQGFVKDLKNVDNISLASLSKFQKGLFQNKKEKWENAFRAGKKVGLAPNDPDFYTNNLSGGNQQKVIIAKWLSTNADILIFDEPTKGIDVGSKADIYLLMEDLVHEGKSIIMISGELPEIIGMSDRIIVMREGAVIKTLNKNEFKESTILLYAVGEK